MFPLIELSIGVDGHGVYGVMLMVEGGGFLVSDGYKTKQQAEKAARALRRQFWNVPSVRKLDVLRALLQVTGWRVKP